VSARRDGFDEFFAARGPQLRRVAFVILRDWHDAEDVVQAAFVKLYLAWPRIRPETVEAYARRAVVNACLSRVRRPRREQVVESLPDGAVHDAEPTSGIPAVLFALPPAQRAVIALRFLDDLSVADVAAVIGISEGAVKSQTARGLKALRAHQHGTSMHGQPTRESTSTEHPPGPLPGHSVEEGQWS
jgi:RNA polymerase sigma-70 factor (sigma-E family)